MTSIFTVAECNAQIANILEQLRAPNAGYSIGPSDGGASRSVSRNDREKLNAELTLWHKRLTVASGGSRGQFRVKRATFTHRC
jgi:hypothetical protein